MTYTHRAIAFLALTSLLASCQNGNSPFKKSGGAQDPYVSNYPSDGGYNPYPDQPGRVAGRDVSYETPVAPVEADPYAFNAPSRPPEKAASSGTKPRTVASSGTKSASPAKRSGGARSGGSTAKKSSSAPSSHTVAKGDTLYGIALKNKTTVAKIKAANGLSSDLIRPGQKLKLR